MILSDRAITRHFKKGNIVISPFKRENLATSSYDVSLGEWYFRESKPKESGKLSVAQDHTHIYNPYSQKHVNKVWGTKPEKAGLAKNIKNLELDGIKPNDRVILIDPGETILAHTQEFIGGCGGIITTMMKARSSMGRNFIEVCKCAGWGDVGYTNRWTMEITNNSRHYTIPLVVGRRIAQIIFFECEAVLEADYTKKGKYQTTPDIKKLKKSWNPKMMLPKLYKDREISA